MTEYRCQWEGGVVGEAEPASKRTSAEAKLSGVDPSDVASLHSTQLRFRWPPFH